MVVRGLFFEGWKMSRTPTSEDTIDAFGAHIARELPTMFPMDAKTVAIGRLGGAEGSCLTRIMCMLLWRAREGSLGGAIDVDEIDQELLGREPLAVVECPPLLTPNER